MGKDGMTKEDSRILQGICISMMLFHHLFLQGVMPGKDYRLVLSFGEVQTEMVIAWFCKICVAMYAYLSGYGMCHVLLKQEPERLAEAYRSAYEAVWKRLKKFYLHFWYVALVSLLVMTVFFGWQLQPKDVLTDLLGITAVYNGSWWYVLQYVKMMMLLPLFHVMFIRLGDDKEERKKWMLYGPVLAGGFLGLLLLGIFKHGIYVRIRQTIYLWFHTETLYAFFVGYLMARFQVYQRADTLLTKKRLRMPAMLLCLCIPVAVRIHLADSAAYALTDYILLPFFTYGLLVLLEKQTAVRKVLGCLGTYSFTMWLIHLFFLDASVGDPVGVLGFHVSPGVFLALLFLSLLGAVLLSIPEKLLHLLKKTS